LYSHEAPTTIEVSGSVRRAWAKRVAAEHGFTGAALQPSALFENYITILIIAVPTLVFIYLIITRPHILLIDNLFFKTHTNHYSIDHKYNESKSNQQQEIDKILDKISKRGINSLSQKEKQMLKDYSKK
jgi:hypothetical protein